MYYLLELPIDMIKQLVEIMRPKLSKEGNSMSQSEPKDLSSRLEKRKKFALTLLNDNFEVAYIAKLTKLSVEEVEELKASLS